MIYLLEDMGSSFGLLDQERAYGAQFVFKQQMSSPRESNSTQQSSSSSQDPFESNNIRRDVINMFDEERREILAKLNFKNTGIDPQDSDLELKIQILSVYLINKAKHPEMSSKTRKVKEKKQKSPRIEPDDALHESLQLGNQFIRMIKDVVAVSRDIDEPLAPKTKVKLRRFQKI
ncbi:MAG: hypothetical protein EZS28_053053, partial [Streblomastix strix]